MKVELKNEEVLTEQLRVIAEENAGLVLRLSQALATLRVLGRSINDLPEITVGEPPSGS